MSLSCPHCGGEIAVIIAPGTDPFPGLKLPQSGSNGRNIPAQFSAQNEIEQKVEGSTKDGRRAYNQDYPKDFLKFWQIYPLKRGKLKALANWRKAIRLNSPEAILAGAIRYRDDPNRRPEFTKYPEGWLAAGMWDDEPLPARLSERRRPQDPPRPYDPLLAQIETERALRGTDA